MSPTVCFVLAAVGSIASKTPPLLAAARALQVLFFAIAPPIMIRRRLFFFQSRSARCCSSLAAALKAAVGNKAHWSLPEGEWGEFIAAVAAIDQDAVHEVQRPPASHASPP